MDKCRANLGVPGAWPCVRRKGHSGAHIAESGQACYTEYDAATHRYDARPVKHDGWSAVPASEVHELQDRLESAHRKIAGLLARDLEKTQALVNQRDRAEKAEENYRFMVENAADQKLDGYRDLAARAAAAENSLDVANVRIRMLRAALQELLRHEVYTYEGNLEARITVPQDAIDDAIAVLQKTEGL